jgi:hypothetical protein
MPKKYNPVSELARSIIKRPNNKQQPSSLCASLAGTNSSLLLYGFSYTIRDFATTNKTKKKYEV